MWFCSNPGEKPGSFLRVVPHHELTDELGEESLNPFPELFVSPSRRSPILLIQPIWNFQSDIGDIEEILLYLSIETVFVTKYHAVVIFPLHVLEIMKIMNICNGHVTRTDDAAYSKTA